ncbi:MAG TPA: adenylate/guanylate cyclase domain-containing protein, partial [Burkholderiaceae bacterium]
MSLATAEVMRRGVHGVWSSVPGRLLLYGAMATHVVAAGQAMWQRRYLRLSAVELLRLGLGLSLPLLLAGHFAATHWAYAELGVEVSYARIVQAVWSPWGLFTQMAMLTAVWTHGCLGLHLALRGRAGYRRLQAPLLTLAVLLPVLAALGMVSMGRELLWRNMARVLFVATQTQATSAVEYVVKFGWLLALSVFALGWLLRSGLQRSRAGATIMLSYPGRTVEVPRGWSVLEASHANGIAHLSLCGGRARCSTCRVRVSGPPENLPSPRRDERRTLARVHASPDVRLACQLRPRGAIEVVPLLQTGGAARYGEERKVAVLFVDIRSWSGLAERQWPFDLVYMLDQYFSRVGAAVRECGGVPNQFIGDSVMAIFGLNSDLPEACRQALRAAALIEQRLDIWGEEFKRAFGQPLDFGMGLHAGPVVLGRVGYQDNTTFTAVGEVVNTASRLQDHSRVAAARLVVSLDAV